MKAVQGFLYHRSQNLFIQIIFCQRGLFLKQVSDFRLRALEDKLNQAAELLKENNQKNIKAAHVGVISELINFFKSEYPELNRQPLKKLLTDVLEVKLAERRNGSKINDGANKYELKVSRKRKTDSLIVAAIELMVEDGVVEQQAIAEAVSILKKRKDSDLVKLLNSYRSSLLPNHIRDLVQNLKIEGRKRFNAKQSALVYLERASQNLK